MKRKGIAKVLLIVALILNPFTGITSWQVEKVEAATTLTAKTFGGTNDDFFMDGIMTSDGSHVVVGLSYSTDGDLQGMHSAYFTSLIVKYDSDGNLEWKDAFGGNNVSDFTAVTEVSDGGFLAVGGGYTTTDGDFATMGLYGGYDAILAKYDSLGNLEWADNFGGSGFEYFLNVSATADGGVIAVGESDSSDHDLSGMNKGNTDGLIVKYDSTGSVEWKTTFGGTSWDTLMAVRELDNGDYVIAGGSRSSDGDLTETNKGIYDALVACLDSSGNLVWVSLLSGSGDERFTHLEIDYEGNIIAGGEFTSNDGDFANTNQGYLDSIVVKLDSSGNQLSQTTYGGLNQDQVNGLIPLDTGDLIVLMNTYSDDGDLFGLGTSSTYSDAVIVKYDSAMNILYEENFGESNDEWATAIYENIDGNYVIAGYTYSNDGVFSGIFHGGITDAYTLTIASTTPTAPTVNSLNDKSHFITGTADADSTVVVRYEGEIIGTGQADGNGDYQILIPRQSVGTTLTLTATSGLSPESEETIVEVEGASLSVEAGLLNYSYGGTDTDQFYAITSMGSGTYAVAGFSYSIDFDLADINDGDGDAVLVVYDSSNNVIQQTTFGGTGYDIFSSIDFASDGKLIAVGETNSTDGDLESTPSYLSDGMIVIYDSEGFYENSFVFGGTGYDGLLGVDTTDDGGFVAVGYSYSNDGDLSGLSNGNKDAVIVKINENYEIVWVKTFGGLDADSFYQVKVLSDGSIVAVGETISSDGDLSGISRGNYDAIVVKYDADGNEEWKKTFGGTSDDFFYDIDETSEGDLIAVGQSISTNQQLNGLRIGAFDAIVVKYDSYGNVTWNKNFGGTATDKFTSVVAGSDGTIVAAGHSYSSNGNLSNMNHGSHDAILVQFDADGNVVWKQNFGGSSSDTYEAVTELSTGRFIAAGISDSPDDDMENHTIGYYDAIISMTAEMPTMNLVNTSDTEVTGIGEVGGTVFIQSGDQVLGSGLVTSQGVFSVDIDTQENGTTLVAYQSFGGAPRSAANSIEVVDLDAPNPPEINSVTYTSTEVTGTAEAGSTVKIRANNVLLGTTTADEQGAFSLAITAQRGGVVISATATDSEGNTSAAATTTVQYTKVTGVTLNKTSITVAVNATTSLVATIAPSDATYKGVAWSSSNTAIATVSSSGVVTGKATGSATITVTTNDGSKTATATVSVVIPVTNVSLNTDARTVEINDTYQLVATVSPNNATTKSVTWSSSNTTVATVNSSGLVTAKKAGQAIITVTTVDGAKKDTATINVVIPVTGVSTDKSSAKIAINSTEKITATVSPTNATNKNVTWTSSNTSVATVSSSGLITAKAVGSATITVTTEDGNFTDTVDVTVYIPVTSVTVNKTSVSIQPNKTSQITATVNPSNATNKKVTWSSSNTNVATVSATGLITAKAVGSATITVTTEDGAKKATVQVTVAIPVTSVTLNKTTATLKVNDTLQVTATVTPSNATNKNVTWTSSNNTIATVSTTGLITAKKAGKATITVTTADGSKTDTVEITVEVPVTSISVNKTSVSLNKGANTTVTATVNPSSATNKTVQWSTSNPNVAVVNQQGQITAIGIGTATITIKSMYDPSIKSTVTVTVK